ncbi:FAD-dependent oxidoreductase [Mycobacterium paragordonae]|nr:FAD-dependent oxidoreductase [Mycobacterium paragordonae]TDK99547.1 FAD-dependent oxidoreductase [Mycobacterium paragordonae]TDL06101.1 FAD-dependent oxidoreductase [Mycobacterium paragordonae]
MAGMRTSPCSIISRNTQAEQYLPAVGIRAADRNDDPYTLDMDESVALGTLATYRLTPEPRLYVIGSFEKGVTVYGQQVRALNLACALMTAGAIKPTTSGGPSQRIAIVGGGFAGLTLAAALHKKGAPINITLFERQDTVLPLQHGCDSRWLHPHIYEWPRPGSEAYSAALPVLNWTSGRASDVVVQVLDEWARIFPDKKDDSIRIFCNAQHLQVASDPSGKLTVEWVGSRRNTKDPSLPHESSPGAVGAEERFDHVVLAIGYGLENKGEKEWAPSYWRNEPFAQPNLGQARMTYIVSGAGDGGLIDLFRLRIANFRQDRILSELFSGRRELTAQLRVIAQSVDADSIFSQLEALWIKDELKSDTEKVIQLLRDRLRNDTTVILHLRKPSFTKIFSDNKASFQNRLLAYLLYKIGAFYPSNVPIDRLVAEHEIPKSRIIIRHGTNRLSEFESVLCEDFYKHVKTAAEAKTHEQTEEMGWQGGYFDEQDLDLTSDEEDEEIKQQWRQEYLPSPLETIAESFTCAVAGYLSVDHPADKRLRVTLHRRLAIGPETVLQQCCNYSGILIEDNGPTAGRTFPAANGAIGLALCHQQVIRTRENADKGFLRADARSLDVVVKARKMSGNVESMAAVPLLTNNGVGTPRSVLGVLYMDSDQPDFFVEDRLKNIYKMITNFLESLKHINQTRAGRLVNTSFWGEAAHTVLDGPAATIKSTSDLRALEFAGADELPVADGVLQLNIDFRDFRPVE